jgi:orotate phosphoribosyltransferase
MNTRLQESDPSVFDVVCDVEDARIILVEDTWITGATALSAAGALIEAGAEAVVITPIAREMKPAYHGDDHPYLEYLTAPYRLTVWPR